MSNQNKFIAIHDRIHDIVKDELNIDIDSSFTDLISRDMKYIDLKLICESIGIDKNDEVVTELIDQFDYFADELLDLMYKKNIAHLISDGYFGGFIPKNVFSPRTYFVNKMKEVVSMFYESPMCKFLEVDDESNITIPEDVVDMFWENLEEEGTSNQKNHVWLRPRTYYDDVVEDSRKSPDNEIPLATILKRIVLRSELYWAILDWLKKEAEII